MSSSDRLSDLDSSAVIRLSYSDGRLLSSVMTTSSVCTPAPMVSSFSASVLTSVMWSVKEKDLWGVVVTTELDTSVSRRTVRREQGAESQKGTGNHLPASERSSADTR